MASLESTLDKVLLAVGGFVLGGLAEWLHARWRRRGEWRAIGRGQRFETIEFVYAFLSRTPGGEDRLHIRTLGSLPLRTFMPSELAREHLLKLATRSHADRINSVIPMEGPMGSFLLRELHGLLHLLDPKSGFPPERWVMVPVLETYAASEAMAPTVFLIRPGDLRSFAHFADSRETLVLNGADGGKVLTCLEISGKFEAQKQLLSTARAEGRSTRYLEEMWVVLLRLDTEYLEPTEEGIRSGQEKPWRKVPWERFAAELKMLDLQS